MKTYKYILLDWDGNLAKTLDVWLRAFHAVFQKRGHNLSDQQVVSGFGAFSELSEKLGVQDIDAALDEARVIANRRYQNVELYPEALELLEYLRSKNKQTALITTSSHPYVDPLLTKYNLWRLFDAVIAADDVIHHKPHPEPVEKALEQLGGNKKEAIIIGDSDKDLGVAINAGIDSILFYPPEHKKFYDLAALKALKPTYIIQDFREVEKIIQ